MAKAVSATGRSFSSEELVSRKMNLGGFALKERTIARVTFMLACSVVFLLASPAGANEHIVLGTFSSASSWTNRWLPQVEYCTAKTGIEVEYMYIPSGSYSEKVILMAAVGDMPDLLLVPPERVASLVDAGLVEDLQPWIERKGEDLRYWFPSAINSTRFRGITLGLPAYVINYTYAYNKEILAKSGLTPPKITEWVTWDKARDIAKKATLDMDGDGVPDIWGFYSGTPFVQVLAFIRQAGGEVYDENGLVQFTSQPVRDAVEYLLGLINDRLHAPSDLFLAGKLASCRFGSGSLSSHLMDQEGLSVGVASGMMGKVKSDVCYVTPWVMPVTSKRKDAAWRYMSCMVSREAQGYVSARGVVPMRRDARLAEDRLEVLTGLINNLEASVSYPYHVENEFVQKSFDTAMRPVWNAQASPVSVLESLDRMVNTYLQERLGIRP